MRIRFLAVTVVVWIAAFLLTRVFWPDTPTQPVPSASQMPFFLVLALIEPLFFGIGVAFLIFAFPWARRAGRIGGMNAWLIYLSVGWLLVSWWPHSNLHRVTEGDLNADAFEVIELDSSKGNKDGFSRIAHSVLALEVREQEGHPAYEARKRVVQFLKERLT